MLGTYRADRHGEGQPDPEAGDMDCPSWVIAEARDNWRDVSAILEGMGLASPSYTPTLAMAINSLGRYIEYERKVGESGPVSVTDKGNEIVNPWWAARNKAWEQAYKALKDMGMTPVSIGSVTGHQSDGEKKDGIAGKLNPKLVG